MTHPYETLPPEAFWRTAIADRSPFHLSDVYRPRFPIGKDTRVATLGSCFAQHMGRELRARGYTWVEAEPPIERAPPKLNAAHQFGVFSFRTGNIYTPAMLRQWLAFAFGKKRPPDEVWQTSNGRAIDPLRPTIHPDGFESAEEALRLRGETLKAIAANLPRIDVLIFTLGQTEAWRNTATGNVYAACPGTTGGTFDPERHHFMNFTFGDCLSDMRAALKLIWQANPAIRVLLTVSPVPMVATATGQHVLVANTRTKTLLRTVATVLCEEHEAVDYFPSYELITQPPFRGMFYDPNLRTVSPAGVAHVMAAFFGDTVAAPPMRDARKEAAALRDELICEEVLLDAAS